MMWTPYSQKSKPGDPKAEANNMVSSIRGCSPLERTEARGEEKIVGLYTEGSQESISSRQITCQ